MHIYYSVVLIKWQAGQQTYSPWERHDPISAKDLLWPQRPCHDGADTFMSCELERWQAGLWPSVAQSLVELREVCTAFLEAETWGQPDGHPFPRLSLVRGVQLLSPFSSRGRKLYHFFFPMRRTGWAAELSLGKADLEHLFWTMPEQYRHSHWFWDVWVIPQVWIKEQPSSRWIFASYAVHCLLSSRPCLNPIISIKNLL